MNINEKLKKIRMDNNLTQRELSEKLDVSYSMIQKTEIGWANPSSKYLLKFADFFNIPINDLINDGDINQSIIDIEKSKNLTQNEILLQALLLILKNIGYTVNEKELSNSFSITNNNITFDIPKKDLISISESVKNQIIELLKIYNLSH
mgnify:CR=1 FL=1